jgi:hypothetical protein
LGFVFSLNNSAHPPPGTSRIMFDPQTDLNYFTVLPGG